MHPSLETGSSSRCTDAMEQRMAAWSLSETVQLMATASTVATFPTIAKLSSSMEYGSIKRPRLIY